MTRNQLLAYTVMVVVLFGCACPFGCLYWLGGGSPTRDRTAGAGAVAVPEVTADRLYAAYTANEIAADRDYKGKAVRVYGPVRDIGKDILGTPTVQLDAGQPPATVSCSFTASDGLANLRVGEWVMVEGTVTGKTLGFVAVKGCRFVRTLDPKEVPRAK
jgi:hypothetical protein